MPNMSNRSFVKRALGEPKLLRCFNRSLPQGRPERAARSSPSAAESTTSPEGKRQEEEEQSSPPTEKEARLRKGAREYYGISLPRVEPGRSSKDASSEEAGGRGSRSDPVPLRLSRAEEDRPDETL